MVGCDARRREHVLEQGEGAGCSDAGLIDGRADEAAEFSFGKRLVEWRVGAEDAAARVLEHGVDKGDGVGGDGVHAGCG